MIGAISKQQHKRGPMYIAAGIVLQRLHGREWTDRIIANGSLREPVRSPVAAYAAPESDRLAIIDELIVSVRSRIAPS